MGRGLEAHLGLAVEDLRDDVFNPPPPQAPGEADPPVCPHHPTFVTRSAAGLHPVPVHGGEVVLWRGPYRLELAKAERTDGDALVQWAIGGFLPPERPASCWQLLNEAPPFRNARQAKKGGRSIRCSCEVEVWCVLRVAEPEIRAIFDLFQPILDVACIQAKMVTKGRLNNDKANWKGKVRLECAAAVQFMRTRRWEALITICPEDGGMNSLRREG